MADTKKTQKKHEPNNKITIKEFEWFQVQTKVRELLAELFQPFNKKQTQESLKINDIKRNIGLMTKKLQDHDFLLTQQNAQKPTYVQLQDDKIAMMEKKFSDLEAKQNHQINEMKKVIEVYEGKIYQINNIEKGIEEESQQRMKELKDHKNHVRQEIQLVLKKIDTQNDGINNFKGTVRNSITKIQTKVTTLENRIIDLEDEMKRRVNEIRKNTQSIQNNTQKIAGNTVKISDLDLRLAEREKDSKLSQKFLSKVVQAANEMNFIRNYLQLYQPLYTQMQISQTLISFVKGTQRTRLCLFEETIYAKMHHAILSLTDETLQTKMADYSNKIKRIVNRNKKYLIKLKVDQTIKYGTNTYEIREMDELLMRQEEETVAKPAPVIVPEQQIAALVEEKWSKLSEKMQKKVTEKIDPIATWMNELQEQSLMRVMENDQKFNELKKVVEKSEANLILSKRQLTQLEKEQKQHLNSLNQADKKLKQQIKDLINFCSVFNHIIIQDQIDRQGLALYALRGNQAQQTMPNIQLDEKCLSCSNGNSGLVNQAFKMACLAYNPSEIRIEEKIFTREEILEISTNILDKLKKKIENLPIQNQPQTGKKQQQKKRSRSTVNRNTLMRPEQFKTLQITRNKELNPVLPALSASRRKANEKERNTGSIFY